MGTCDAHFSNDKAVAKMGHPGNGDYANMDTGAAKIKRACFSLTFLTGSISGW